MRRCRRSVAIDLEGAARTVAGPEGPVLIVAFSSGGRSRTCDPRITGPASCLCSTPHQSAGKSAGLLPTIHCRLPAGVDQSLPVRLDLAVVSQRKRRRVTVRQRLVQHPVGRR